MGACAPKSKTCALSLLLEMLQSQAPLPVGDVYVLPDSPSLRALNTIDTNGQTVRAADTALLSAAFAQGGGTSVPSVFTSSVDDGAMRFATSASPFELVVLHCVSRADADKVALLLHERLDILRREYPDNEGALDGAEVVVIGKYAVLLVCKDTKTALHAVQR
jgi:hypothetical protein